MKVNELTGEQLDYWVARALGYAVERANIGTGWTVVAPGMGARVTGLPLSNPMHWAPSQDWAQGGPIIERERINVIRLGGAWAAAAGDYVPAFDNDPMPGTGQTALIAAMRACVASRFCDELRNNH